MFSSIKDDIRGQWNRPNSGMQRLIIINIAVFLLVNLMHLFLNDAQYHDFIRFFAMPTELGTFITRPWTFVTSFFTHTGFSHILWNMLYLYWFSFIIRDFLGSDRLVNIYILGGLTGSLSVLLLFNVVPAFSEMNQGIALGASAGVFAVTVASETLAPDYKIHLLFLGAVKIKYIAGIFVLLAVLGLKGNNVGGEVAHLAGAFIGYYYIRSLQKGNDIGAWVTRTLVFIKSFFVRQPKMKVNYSRGQETRKKKYQTTTESKKSSKPSQAEIDAILEKIHESGYESLTKEEKEKLFNAK